MGKRSNFERVPRDAYPTPFEAVIPLLPHLAPRTRFDEPCCGDGALIAHLCLHGHICEFASDIKPECQRERIDALTRTSTVAQCFITNAPWRRDILHPLIERLSAIAPFWSLHDADWAHTKQARPHLRYCHRIVSVGRVKWIPDSKMTGKDNAAWYLFDQRVPASTVFYGRAAEKQGASE